MGAVLTEITVVGAAIVRGGRCLVARRGPRMAHPGCWEFPGGKVEPGESPEEALAREIREELDCEIRAIAVLGRGTAEIDRRRVVLDVWEAELVSGEPRPREHDRLRWVDADELRRLAWAPADRPVITTVAARVLRSAGGRSGS